MGTALISMAYTVINNLFRIEQPWYDFTDFNQPFNFSTIFAPLKSNFELKKYFLK